MSSPSTLRRQIDGRSRNAKAHHIGVPLATSELPRRPGGFLSDPRKLTTSAAGGTCNRLTKLLINVNVERCFGPAHVVVSPENNVGDLIKTAVETYVKEKRRPLLADANCRQFELHYNQFSLQSLKPEEKLINLGSRNFFLCTKSSRNAANSSSCLDESREAAMSPLSPKDITLIE